MGPLVPDIIGNELNLVIALFIGLLFGAILEQAGFSSSKKLVGLFYGYDFTVLRVFFTAGTVAMVGIILFDHFGLLDVSVIYINPTFLWSGLIGGAIMGLGFVVGGFCPGTSICAAAIGKLDAMFFILGSVVGILFFTEGYSLLQGVYKGEFLGYPQMFETLGVSRGVFAFLLGTVALLSFAGVTLIENKVNGIEERGFGLVFSPVTIFTAACIIMALFATLLPERKEAVLEAATTATHSEKQAIPRMTADELAYRIMDDDRKLQIFDFRPIKAFKSYSLPKSVPLAKGNLFEKETANLLSRKGQIRLFLAEDEEAAIEMVLAAHELGFKNISVLQGGLKGFKQKIIDFSPTAKAAAELNDYTLRFRKKAARVIPILIDKNKTVTPVKKKQKRVLGGC